MLTPIIYFWVISWKADLETPTPQTTICIFKLSKKIKKIDCFDIRARMKAPKLNHLKNQMLQKNITMKVMRTLEEEMYNHVSTKYDVG